MEYFDLGVELKSEKIDQSAKETISIPIPVIGLAGDYVIGYGVGIWGKIGWIGLEIQDIMASYTDLEIGFSFKWKYLFAVGCGSSRIFMISSKNINHFFKRKPCPESQKI